MTKINCDLCCKFSISDVCTAEEINLDFNGFEFECNTYEMDEETQKKLNEEHKEKKRIEAFEEQRVKEKLEKEQKETESIRNFEEERVKKYKEELDE